MNNKNYLVWGTVALIVALGGYFLLQGYSKPAEVMLNQPVTTETATPTAIATTSGEVMAKITVDYTDKGFLPKTITIKVGEKVTWTNKSANPMWVASAVHPTHNVLPGFDELTSVVKGETYSYTFAKAGNWRYHNHVGPSDTGVVVVE